MNNDDAPETLLNQVAEILEAHTKTLQDHRQAFERLFEEIKKINQRLDKLESGDSINFSDAKFLMDITARLKAISTTLDAKV